MTSAKITEAYKKLNFHFSDELESIVARNILMLHIISNGFNPDNPTDVQYLWDVWFGLQWKEATRKRFIKDVNQVMTGQWTASHINIPDPEGVKQLNKICSFWLDTVKANHVRAILASRYVY